MKHAIDSLGLLINQGKKGEIFSWKIYTWTEHPNVVNNYLHNYTCVHTGFVAEALSPPYRFVGIYIYIYYDVRMLYTSMYMLQAFEQNNTSILVSFHPFWKVSMRHLDYSDRKCHRPNMVWNLLLALLLPFVHFLHISTKFLEAAACSPTDHDLNLSLPAAKHGW